MAWAWRGGWDGWLAGWGFGSGGEGGGGLILYMIYWEVFVFERGD